MKIWMLIIPALMIIAVLPCTINTVVFMGIVLRARQRKPELEKRVNGDQKLLKRWNAAAAILEDTPHERICIQAFDGVKLSADWYPGNMPGAVLLFHGYHSSPLRNCGLQAADLISEGWSVLLPWQRAHGNSGGVLSGMGYLEAQDILSWNEWVHKEKMIASTAILGVSMGGCALGQCSTELPANVKAIVIDCAYDSFLGQFTAKALRCSFPFRCNMKETFRKFQHTDISQKASDRLAECSIPALFAYGEKDAEVPAEDITCMYQKHKGEKQLFISRGAGHARSYEAGGENAKEALLLFVNAHLRKGGS